MTRGLEIEYLAKSLAGLIFSQRLPRYLSTYLSRYSPNPPPPIWLLVNTLGYLVERGLVGLYCHIDKRFDPRNVRYQNSNGMTWRKKEEKCRLNYHGAADNTFRG